MSTLENTTKRTRTAAAKKIELAIKKLQTVGWTQGTYQRTDAAGKPISFCAIGALDAVKAPPGVGALITEYLQSKGKIRMNQSVISFNDAEGTTKRKVLDAMRGTIRMIQKFDSKK